MEIKFLTEMLAVPYAIHSAELTANMSARRLKRSVKRRMYEFPRSMIGRGPNELRSARAHSNYN